MEIPLSEVHRHIRPDSIRTLAGAASTAAVIDSPPELEPHLVDPTVTSATSIDIYRNLECHGAGTAENPDLCRGCFLTTPQLRSKEVIDQPTTHKILDWATRPGSPIKLATWVGGNNLLLDDLSESIKAAHARGLGNRLVTNASPELLTLLTDPEVIEIMQDGEGRGNLIAFSKDSSREWQNDDLRGAGATERVNIGMQKARELGIPFRVNITLSRFTASSLRKTIRDAEQRGAKGVLVHAFSPIGRGARMGKRTTNPADLEIYYLDFYDPTDPAIRKKFRPTSISEELEPEEWEQHRGGILETYEPGRTDFTIEFEEGFAQQTTCHLRKPKVPGLQFMPPARGTGGLLPVVTCGLFAPTAPQKSGFLFDPISGEMYRRAGGNSELAIAENSSGSCPARPNAPEAACIYERLTSRPVGDHQGQS